MKTHHENLEYIELIKNKENYKQENNKYKCPICSKEYTKFGINKHLKYHFGYISPIKGKISHKKGKTKYTDESIKRGAEKLKEKYASGELIPFWRDKKLSEEHKQKISDTAKRDYKNGTRLVNWKHETYITEIIFMQYIDAYINNKNYIHHKRFGKYEADFTWVELRKIIEIDGDQHYRTDKRVLRDKNKDELLNQLGYEVLRIRWKNFNNNKKYWIDIAKQFIDDGISIKFEDNYQQFLKEQEIMNNIKKQKELDKIDKLHDIAIKVNKIIDSNIDFTKFGWVEQVNKITGQTNSRRWIKRWCPWLLENTFIKNKENKNINIFIKRYEKDYEDAIKINKIIDSNIDFTKYGWVKRVAEILNIHHRWVRPWINKRYPDLILNAHCRNKIVEIK